ncbi:LPS translocon maturation chaperone LptM [Psychromonas sp.]|uniref:LPS translocon maturation chaperone LptM n=1 Tax=Psychromonas sp. TaxID=1884585 RepID=UPI0039E6BC84
MKNINLSIAALLFAALLTGCGKSGSLYRTPEPETQVKPQNTAPSPAETADSDTKKITASE